MKNVDYSNVSANYM